MKKILVILVGVIWLFAGDGVSYACDELSSQLVAKAYVLTMPLVGRDNEMIPLMERYPEHFAQGGGAIRCMQNLGSALVQSGLSRYQEFKGPSATERFGGMMPEGLEHLPGQVDLNMNSYGSDSLTIGQELLWLAKVLPFAAQGNYAPYNNPTTINRQMAVQLLPLYQMMCQIDASICQMMLSALNEMKPQIEQQILYLARQPGN